MSETYDMFEIDKVVWGFAYSNEIKQFKVVSARTVEEIPIHCKEIVLKRIDYETDPVILAVFKDSPAAMYGFYRTERDALLKVMSKLKSEELRNMHNVLSNKSSYDKMCDQFNKLQEDQVNELGI
jgi:hypothetical protein